MSFPPWFPALLIQGLFANIVLGLALGAVLRFGWRAPFPKAAAWMLAGLYSLLGVLILLVLSDDPLGFQEAVQALLGAAPLENLGPVLLSLAIAGVVLLAVWLLPAVRLALGSEPSAGWTAAASIVVSIAAAGATGVGWWYGLGCHVPRVDPGMPGLRGMAGTVYFLTEDGDVGSVSLDGSGSRTVLARANPEPDMGCLSLEPGTAGWSLSLVRHDSIRPLLDLGEGMGTRIPIRFVASGSECGSAGPSPDGRDAVLGNLVAYLEPVAEVRWGIDRGEWEVDASDRQYGATREIRLVLPALSWRVEDVTLVQGGMVVFRWGPQIVLADLDNDRVAMLARGRSPIVFVGEAPASGPRATSQ